MSFQPGDAYTRYRRERDPLVYVALALSALALLLWLTSRLAQSLERA
jgi:hypothetical protein